ncbi:hypothetical protein N7540_006002 [Penicillium herquei]|nr:hypothetical protein N7540_006002 [Penicillium herquei]
MSPMTSASEAPSPNEDPLLAVVPQESWWRSPNLRRLNFCVLSLALYSSSSGYDGSLVNGLEALDSWTEFMENPSTQWLGFINAIYWIGALVSTSLAAWTCNYYGRRIGIWIGTLLLVTGGILGAAAPGANAFIVSRAILGCSMGWILLPLVALPGFIMTPESPRWLIYKGRTAEATTVLANLHAGGDTSSHLVIYEVCQIEGTLAAEKEATESMGYADMIKTPGNRYRLFVTVTLGIFAQWGGNGVVSYYLSEVLDTIGITETRDQLLISACLQCWNFIFVGIGASVVEKAGRRMLFITSAGVMLTSFVIITALSGSFATIGSSATGTAVIPFLFIYFAGYDVALTPMLTAYPCEIWPFALRSRGLNVLWLSSISVTVFNTFANPIALAAIQWKYYFVFIAVLVCYALTAYFVYPETRGHSLEHIAQVFDGEQAVAASNERAMVYMSKATDGEKSGAMAHQVENA